MKSTGMSTIAEEPAFSDLAFREQITKNGRHVTLAALVIVVAVIAIMGLSSYEQLMRASQARGLVGQAHKVIAEIEFLEHLVQEAENEQRGYLLTKQGSYLAAYAEKVKQIPQHVASVKNQINDNDEQQKRLAAIESVIQAKIAELNETISVGQHKGLDAAVRKIHASTGNHYMEQIRTGLHNIRDEEEKLFRQRLAIAEEHARQDVTRLVVLACLRILIVVGAAYLINRTLDGILQSQRRLLLQYACTKILSEAEDTPNKIVRILAAICENLGLDVGAFWVLDPDTNMLRCSDFWSSPTKQIPEFAQSTKSAQLSPGKDLPGKVWQSRAAVWIPDVTRASDFSRAALAAREGLRAGFAFPVPLNDADLAVIELFDDKARRFNRALLETVSSCGVQIGLSLARAKARQELAESEGRFRQMADNIQEMFWITDARGGRPIYVSPGYEKIFGRTVDSLFANPAQFFEVIHMDDRDKVADLIRHQRECKSDTQIEFRIMREDGETRWVWARLCSIRDEQGQVTELCGAIADITERKQADKRVSEFYSTVSHELRTPLTSIRGSLGLIEGGMAGDISPKVRELVEIGRAESDRLIRLINDILDIKKIETGNFRLNKATIDPGELIARTLEGMSGMAAQANVVLQSSISSASPVHADQDKVTQVLTNLLSNAIKFSPAGSTVTISVTDGKDGMVRFAVSDQGPGIKDQDLHKLFVMFQQIDQSDSRAKGGSGLGLAICKSIVERHGGKIGVDTKLQQGCTFWFELPAERSGPARASEEQAERDSDGADSGSAGQRQEVVSH